MEKEMSLFDEDLSKAEVKRSGNRRKAMIISKEVGMEMAKKAFKELELEQMSKPEPKEELRNA